MQKTQTDGARLPDFTAMPLQVTHVIKGVAVSGADQEYSSSAGPFATPALDLSTLVWPRNRPGPAFDLPIADILDFLEATGKALAADQDGLLAEAAEQMVAAGPYDRGIVERSYASLPRGFSRERVMSLIDGEIGDIALLDGWVPFSNRMGESGAIRAFPARLVHILAGNAPGVAASTIVRGAVTKGVHLLKLPSNDLFTAPAILRTMASIDADHPLVRSFSAVYWRGGDKAVEGRIFRPQYFDKLVAWGGDAAIRSAKDYIGPGFELVSFDPKTSIAMIGREALDSPEAIADTAERAAIDSTPFNQAACVSARFHFVEADNDAAIDSYCAELQRRMGIERPNCSAIAQPVEPGLREEIETLRDFSDLYKVWGSYEGAGLVIRSEEPVDFHPDGKIVNVVRVPSLEDALSHATVATQTVGVFPAERKRDLRDRLASAGVQRVVTLGGAIAMISGMSHDGFFPLHRMVRWVNDEDGQL